MVGFNIQKRNGFTVLDFVSANILELHIKQLVGKGYKQGDKLSIKIIDAACTNWEINKITNGIELNADGLTEMHTLAALLISAGTYIMKMNSGMSEYEVAEYLNTTIRSKIDPDSKPQPLQDFKHIIHLGKYKGRDLDTLDDLPYLTWFHENVKLSPQFKQAVKHRINYLSNLMK